MNKTDLINQVSESTELSKKDVTKAVDAVFEAISGALQSGDKVQLVGFGNFEVRELSARKGVTPQTGEEFGTGEAHVGPPSTFRNLVAVLLLDKKKS
ncbi:HU family DNA-binding protein, partial [Paenibacillus sp. 28ISP30-2]|nr:HU family DNA-binding protein [Paenibacillus sp. 28ISP30-2]